MNKSFIFYTLATLSLMACSSSDDEQQGTPPAKRPLTVVVNETPFMDENGNAQVSMRQGTRGTVITTGTLEQFYMSYNENEYTVKKSTSTGKWDTELDTWPVDYDKSISFYAYNAGTYTPNENSLSFTVPENASTQTDLLVAETTTSYNAHQGQVNLTFNHACAAVDFKLRISDLLAETHNTLTITDITLKNVANEGDYYYNNDNGGWRDVKGTGTYTLNDAEMSLTKEPKATTCGTLFMIPQTLGDAAVLSFKYGGVEKTISLMGAKWEKGTQYVMDIVIGKKTLGLE